MPPSYLKVSQIGSLGHSEHFGITYRIQREEGGRWLPYLKVSCKFNLSKLFMHCKNTVAVSVSYCYN